MEPVKKCTKCSDNPASNGHPWCQPCRTEHARATKERESEMIGARNFQAGANALRHALAEQLGRAPGALYESTQVAHWIMAFPTPSRPAE